MGGRAVGGRAGGGGCAGIARGAEVESKNQKAAVCRQFHLLAMPCQLGLRTRSTRRRPRKTPAPKRWPGQALEVRSLSPNAEPAHRAIVFLRSPRITRVPQKRENRKPGTCAHS